MNKKFKVLFVLPSLIGGGAERVFTYLINHIDRERFEPHLALGAKRGAYLHDISDDVSIYQLNGERARNATPSLIKLVRKIRPDVVFSTVGMNFANSFGRIFYPSGTRIVLREGSSVTAFLEDVARESRATAFVYRKTFRILYNLSDSVICQSDFMLHDNAKNLGIAEKRLHRIYNPVDFEKIDRLSKESSEKLLPEGVFNFVAVGNLLYCKGYDILLKAFAEAHEKNENIALTILGEGEERENLERLRNDLGLDKIVKMPGFVKNPYKYIKQADACISSSRYEGFANVIVEALACGKPVVATDCPSANREVIKEGFNGWFAQNEDVTSLAETLLKATAEAKNLDAKQIRADCESRFAIRQILPRYEELLKA